MLRVLELERHEILGPLHKVVKLVVSRVGNNDSIIQVQVIVKSKHVHRGIIDLVGLVALVIILIILLIVLEVVSTVDQPSVAVSLACASTSHGVRLIKIDTILASFILVILFVLLHSIFSSSNPTVFKGRCLVSCEAPVKVLSS